MRRMIVVGLVAVGLLVATAASAEYAECKKAREAHWLSWGQNVACLHAIMADIIGFGGD